MPQVVPSGRKQAIEFFEARVSSWFSNAAAIGLSPASVTAFITEVSDSRDMLDAAEQARIASKVATQGYYTQTDTMRERGTDLVAVIKAFAENTDNPNVYDLAQIPHPAPPTPVPAPLAPTDLTGTLSANGTLTLRWASPSGSGPSSGIWFQVFRRVGKSGAFSLYGGSQSREFIDQAVPVCSGDGAVEYQVQARRGQDASPKSTQFVVEFPDGPTLNVSDEQGGELKIAA